MKRVDVTDVGNAVRNFGVVPVVVLEDAASAVPLADALVAGGLPVAEVTFRTRAAAEAIEQMRTSQEMLVGAGTVLRVEQVDRAVEAGAQFIVSPGLSRDVVLRCQELGVPVFPGAVTPTEIMAALDLGLDVCKFFPAGTYGGVAAIKSLGGPFGQVSFIPTGGVNPGNLAEYLSLPNVAAVGGTWVATADAVSEGRFAEVEELARDAVATVARVRGER